MADIAMQALRNESWKEAAARYAQRLLINPDDGVARCNHAVALYEQDRWADAAAAFEELIRREGPFGEATVPALFSLGYCRLELDEHLKSLAATTMFLELSNRDHPFYWDGVQNTACAYGRLGHARESAALYRTVLAVQPPRIYAFNGLSLALDDLGRPREALFALEQARARGLWDDVLESSLAHLRERADGPARKTRLAARPWSRRRLLRTSFRLLGWEGEPLEARALRWRVESG